jgi:formylmethanofuran dehydrogenase subunit E
LEAYQVMPLEALLRVEPVTLTIPLAQIIGRPGLRATCSVCEEEILNQRELVTPAGTICPACAAEPYYRGPQVPASVNSRD